MQRDIPSILADPTPFGFDRRRLQDLGWRVLDEEQERSAKELGLAERFGKQYVPLFAREGTDEIICTTNDDRTSNAVKAYWIQDYSDPGFEVDDEFDDIQDWYSDITS